MFKFFISIASLFVITNAQAGFVSSNGMSMPVGMVCQEDGSQLQLKLEGWDGYRLRRVAFDSNGQPQVTYLTENLGCAGSRYQDEPVIENTCQSIDKDLSESVQVIPHRDKVLILVHSISDGIYWYSFDQSQCSVELDTKILP